MTIKVRHFIMMMLVSMSMVACNTSTSNDEGNKETALKGEVKVDGSSTVYPITEAMAEEFRNEAPEVKVTVGVSGTGGGFKKFSRGETDLSDASRPIKEKEVKACKESNISYQDFTVAYDGLAVIINPENSWAETITVEELKKMWEPAAQGVILKWNQIRPEWPDEEIHLFGPGIASGTYDYFTEAIIGESGSSRGDYTASEDDNVLVQGVAGDKLAIGFFGLAYFEENADRLKLVGVDNGNGPVKPSLETVKDGSYTPLSRPLFVYVNSTAIQRPEVVSFMHFYLENASVLSKEVGYVPLPSAEYDHQKELLNKFIEEHQAK